MSKEKICSNFLTKEKNQTNSFYKYITDTLCISLKEKKCIGILTKKIKWTFYFLLKCLLTKTQTYNLKHKSKIIWGFLACKLFIEKKGNLSLPFTLKFTKINCLRQYL